MEKLRKPLMEVAKTIKWIPTFGLERELDWLKNMQDWLISKKRYWGLALPIYECSCGNFEVVGSKEELKKRAVDGWEKFEGHSPHRPWVDEVKIKCQKCRKLVSRIPDVGNPWLDAGIVPFSTMGYYKNKEYWKEWFPADLVCESFPGQFKNWFYSIIVMSMVLENVAPIKTIFGYASVRDEKGEEMHKSKGNAIWFDEAVEEIGADPMRWMYSRQNPVDNLKFGYGSAEEIKRKLLTLFNVYSFFETYVSKKEIPNPESQIPNSRNILDRWIISRMNNLVGKVTRNLDKYNVSVATIAIEDFFIDELSLWYLRRSRERFHQGFKGRKEAISTLYYVLLNLLKLIAPITPFFSEAMYANLRLENMPESVHLAEYPKPEKKLINQKIEEKMKEVRSVVTLVLAQRAKAGIKVRQPLGELRIKNKELRSEKELLELIKDEVNVKKITFGKELKLDTKITKDLKKEGEYREIVRNVMQLRKELKLTPENIVTGVESTAVVHNIKDFLKETKAKNFKKVEKEKEMDVDAKKEIKLDGQTYYIGIKK